MATLLLELFSEEIPSRMQQSGAEQLQRLVLAGLEKNMLKASEVKTFVSPRHLAIQCFGLPTIQPDVKEERRGPKIGAPEQAIKGFLSSTGLTLEQCEQRDGYYYARLERKGRAVAEVAKEIIETALNAFVWPKSMKWGARSMQWVRPLHKITCLLDEQIVPLQFGHLTASNITHGHRFLAPGEIKITHAEKYESLLADANVMVDFAARRAKIAAEIAAAAASAKLTLHEDAGLLDEVTGLVEYPVPLLCEFDAKFLDLPPEVLISEMKNHQRYFALYGVDGKLTNRFITVANMVNADGGARVQEGNARVVRARLADGEFYWEQDRKVKLEDWGQKLADVVFHAKVGMMNEKVARIEKLALEIAKTIGFTDEKSVSRAAQLCKADLTSGMVGEFPELQGIMGRYYATAQGESQEVADAIRDHCKPLGANDSLPDSSLAAIIALADKLDSIISLFAAGEKPTGSKDPLALRRAALGILAILRKYNYWPINLGDLIPEAQREELWKFFVDRLKASIEMDGNALDTINAVLSTPHHGYDVTRLRHRAHFITLWRNSDDSAAITSIRRTLSMLAAEEAKAKKTYQFDNAKQADAAGEALREAIVAAQLEMKNAPLPSPLPKLPQNQVQAAMAAITKLAAPIDAFFDAVLVTEEGYRDTRLSLLAGVRELAIQFADFSKLEG